MVAPEVPEQVTMSGLIGLPTLDRGRGCTSLPSEHLRWILLFFKELKCTFPSELDPKPN